MQEDEFKATGWLLLRVLVETRHLGAVWAVSAALQSVCEVALRCHERFLRNVWYFRGNRSEARTHD